MKRIPGKLQAQFVPTRLYKDDVQRLHDLFFEYGGDVELQSGQFQLESVSELTPENLSSEYIRELRIETRTRPARLVLTPSSTVFQVDADDMLARGFHKMAVKLLTSRQGPFNALPLASFLAFVVGVLVVANLDGPWRYVAGVAFGIIGAYGVFGYLHATKYRHSTIVLTDRLHSPGFFKRNKDALVLVLVTVALTALATIGIQQWFTK